MSTCLGLYIEENLIKYAKVSREKDQIKVESFGVKTYDNLEKVVKQIVEETYSYKIPISVNLSDEVYNYFELFALLSKKDLPKAIKTEFESFCATKNYNSNAFETRYAITPNTQDKEKIRVIHVSENKINLNKLIQKFAGYKLEGVIPVSMAIPSITTFQPKENCLIVNIEHNTTITTILQQNIYDINKLDAGCGEMLDKLNLKENSYKKAYEILKETTIYTSEGQELDEEETDHLEDIMPTLYTIVGAVKKIIMNSLDKINKVYITGTGALINNIDLYFEEYLEGTRCEILRPNFVRTSPEINIKDYVEVNSAISIALTTLGIGIAGMNFQKNSILDRISEALGINSGGNNLTGQKRLRNDLKEPFDKGDWKTFKTGAYILTIFIVYCVFSAMIAKSIDNKSKEATDSIADTNSQMELVDADTQGIKNKSNEYATKVANLKKLNNKIEDNNKSKKEIPNLLNRLMYIMPDKVQLTSIKSSLKVVGGDDTASTNASATDTANAPATTDTGDVSTDVETIDTVTHIEIEAQSTSYAELGYLTAGIKTNGILTNVVTTSGQKENNLVTIKIEGDLP